MNNLFNLFSTKSVDGESSKNENTFKVIHDEILDNIMNEGDLDLSNASEDQIESEVFHRFHLRALKECADKIIDFKRTKI